MTEIECKTPNITNLTNQAVLNTKATEIQNKIPDITGFIITPEFNRLTKKYVLIKNERSSEKPFK